MAMKKTQQERIIMSDCQNFVGRMRNRIRDACPLYQCFRGEGCEASVDISLNLSKEIQRIDGIHVSSVELVCRYKHDKDNSDLDDEYGYMIVDIFLQIVHEQHWMRNGGRDAVSCTDEFELIDVKSHRVKRPRTKEEWWGELDTLVDFKDVYESIHDELRRLRYSHIHQSFYLEDQDDEHLGFHAYMVTPANECATCSELTTHKSRCNHYLCLRCETKILYRMHGDPQCPVCGALVDVDPTGQWCSSDDSDSSDDDE